MANLANNTGYLRIGTFVVSAEFIEVSLTPSNSSSDTTSGFGTTHVKRQPGLNDTKIKIRISYDTDVVATLLTQIAMGTLREVEWGPEGQVSGKPRHVQEFNLTAAGHGKKVTKEMVVFEIEGEGAAAPTVNMYASGVYA